MRLQLLVRARVEQPVCDDLGEGRVLVNPVYSVLISK